MRDAPKALNERAFLLNLGAEVEEALSSSLEHNC